MAVGSFSAGLSGLNANSTYLSVIGNNLANINTVGFKTSAVSFADLVSQTVGGTSVNPAQVGLGVVTGAISPVFAQGSIENSREATNVAIQGAGFFSVRDGSRVGYTRAGNFSFDDAGVLITPDGWRVQGYTQTDPVTGNIITAVAPNDITIPPGVLRAPTATTNIRAQVNLDPNGPDFRSISGVTNTVPNPNEPQPKSDEWSLTFERELVANWAVRGTGVYARNFDLRRLAEDYEMAGGDIRNAVLKAALAAAAEPVPDSMKRIHQHHFEASIREVIAAQQVMRQSLFAGETLVLPDSNGVAGGPASLARRLLVYALPCAALLVALIALAVALLIAVHFWRVRKDGGISGAL